MLNFHVLYCPLHVHRKPLAKSIATEYFERIIFPYFNKIKEKMQKYQNSKCRW